MEKRIFHPMIFWLLAATSSFWLVVISKHVRVEEQDRISLIVMYAVFAVVAMLMGAATRFFPKWVRENYTERHEYLADLSTFMSIILIFAILYFSLNNHWLFFTAPTTQKTDYVMPSGDTFEVIGGLYVITFSSAFFRMSYFFLGKRRV